MWWKFAKAVPFLLASSVQQYAPKSLKEIKHGMNQIYQDLVDTPGNFSKQVTPTIRFSHVTPPLNGKSTWRASSSMEDEEVIQHYYDYDPSKFGEEQGKPIAIYLPGLDGTGISAFTHQFDDMAQTFELWRMIITTDDRSEFRQVLGSVVGFVEEIARNNTNRDVVLVGESFGGVLAAAVALNVQKRSQSKLSGGNYRNPLKGLVLVNPATAFHETNWELIVPVLASLQYFSNNDTGSNTPTPYSVAGGLALSYLIPDSNQLERILDLLLNVVGIPPVNRGESIEDIYGLLEILEERLPAGTLQHRVSQWLSVGTSLVNERINDLQAPTLVVAGDRDRIMPSDKEVERLIKVIPACEKLLVRGRGHFVLDEGVNLTGEF
jgi:pimeloyl-ACP methyl ester carboxylesterase